MYDNRDKGCTVFKVTNETILKFLTSGVTGNPSSKRLIVYRANQVVLGSFALMSVACSYWIIRHGDLGTGAIAALTSVGGMVVGIAIGYGRRPDQEPKHTNIHS